MDVSRILYRMPDSPPKIVEITLQPKGETMKSEAMRCALMEPLRHPGVACFHFVHRSVWYSTTTY